MSKQSITDLDVKAFEYLIKKRMKADETFTDYDFDGSGLSAIVRLLAMDSNTLGFVANMLSGESHLMTAQQRSNVALSSQMLSYTPHNHQASFLYATVVVTPYDPSTAPESLVLDTRALFVGAKDGKTYPFTPSETVETKLVDNKYTFESIKLVQGTWMYKTYTVEGSAISSYKIPSEFVDIDYIKMQVRADETSDDFTTYTRYKTPYQLDQYANLYFVELGIDGLYTIEAGDGYISNRLSDLNLIYLQYLVTAGIDGNDITSISSASSVGGFSQVDVVMKSERSVGGGSPETNDSIQRMAPLAYQADGSAVAESDYGSLVRKLSSNVSQARAYGGDVLALPATGYVYIAVIPKVGDVLSDEEKRDLEEQLDKYNVGSITPKIVDADIYYLNVTTLLYWDPTTTVYSEEQLKTLVATNIANWSKSNLEGFTEIFDKQILESDITDFERSIISNITKVSYGKKFSPTPGVSESFSIEFNRSIKPGSVYISGFKPVPAEVDYVYHMRDVSGVINLYKTLTTDLGKEFLVASTGNVDYTNGIVNIKSLLVSKFDDGGISMTVAPDGDNENFTAVQNQLLRIGSVQVNTEVRYVNRSK